MSFCHSLLSFSFPPLCADLLTLILGLSPSFSFCPLRWIEKNYLFNIMLELNRKATVAFFQCFALLPFFTIFIIGIFAMIVSAVSALTARAAFVNKIVVRLLTEMREKDLKKQKAEQERLILSIFPRAIAKNLIENQAQRKEGSPEGASDSTRNLRSHSFSPSRLGSNLAW